MAIPEPDFIHLLKDDGNTIMSIGFRKGAPVAAYIRLRQWCWRHDLNFADLMNAIIVPLAYFCENFTRRNSRGNIVVTINLGDVEMPQIYSPRPPGANIRGRKSYKDRTAGKKKYKTTRSSKIELI